MKREILQQIKDRQELSKHIPECYNAFDICLGIIRRTKFEKKVTWIKPENAVPDTSRKVLSFIDEQPVIVYYDLAMDSFVYNGVVTDVECWMDIVKPDFI